MVHVLYQHAEGMGSIAYDAQEEHLIIRNDETNEVAHAVVNAQALKQVAAALLQMAHIASAQAAPASKATSGGASDNIL